MRRGKRSGGAGARWFAIVLIACTLPMLGQSPAGAETVNLDQVIRQALTGSLNLQKAKNKIDSAEGQLLEAKSQFDWTTLAETGWQRFIGPIYRNGVPIGQTGYIDAWRSTVEVSKEFTNGITMSPGVTTLITPQNNLQALGYQTVLPTVNLTIPLDRGLGTDSADANEHAAAAALRGSRLDYDFASQRAVHDAVQLFWRCLADAQQRLVMLETDQEKTEYERWLQTMVRGGQMEAGTLQQAEADHALSNQQLDSANEGVLRCRRELADNVGSKERLLEPIGELPHPERYGPAIDKLRTDPLVAYAFDNRRDLRALKAYIDGQRDRVKGAKDELNPKIDVILDPFQALVRYTQTINRYSAKGHIAKTMADESNAEIALELGRQAARTNIANAVVGLQELWHGWPALIAAQRKLERLEEETEKRVKAGSSDRTYLRQVQDELAQAEHAVIDARLKLASILASLRLYTGALVLNGDSPATVATEFSTLPQP